MPTVSLNGTELFYKVVGDGEPCLVMHGGMGFDHTMVHPGLDGLSDMFRLIYYDHRGNGRSGRPPLHTLTWEQLAHDADALRGHLGCDRMSIVAHSFGAFPALEYALRYPGSLYRLILVAAVPAFDYFPQVVANMKARGASDELIALFDFSKVTNDEVFKTCLYQLAPLYFHRPTPELIDRALGRVRFCAEACRVTPSLIASYSMESRLPQIRAKTLIMAGADDFVTPLSQVRRLYEGIPHAEMVVFGHSGHLPYLEEPERFVQAVRDWVMDFS